VSDDKERQTETVPKINVILQPAKNLIFFFSNQNIKKRDPSAYSLRMTRKGKLARILEQF
jgi:hemin uptake protein HemP